MLDLRTRIILIIGIPTLIIVVLFGFLFFRNKAKQQVLVNEKMNIEDITTNPPAVKTDDGLIVEGTQDNIKEIVTPETTEEKEALYIKQLSRIFVERFLSYSNQNNNEHLADVLPLASKNMQTWIQEQQVTQSGEYQGMTTKVISTEIIAITNDTATVNIGITQEIMTLNTSTNSQKSGKLDFIRDITGQWKVSGLFLEE